MGDRFFDVLWRKETKMNKLALLVAFLFFTGLSLYVTEGKAQMGPGMMGPGYDYGYGMGPGMMGGWVTVPDKLPTPKNADWVQKLREILVLEKTSYAQYTADADKYNAAMPYMRVIPQEEDHINLIERLFAAYGLKSDEKPRSVVETKSLKEAFELCERMERELIPRYTWLVQNAEDRDSAGVLNNILFQTRWHLTMFQHALAMGGYGMGPGMMWGRGMGSGMMGQGYGGLYGPRFQQRQKPLDKEEARQEVENYLKSMRNPNLKLGEITDKGSYFEADIVTKDNSLVNKVDIDKTTGWMRPAY
jgi:hypothetical protein